jgi:hypothetical protein
MPKKIFVYHQSPSGVNGNTFAEFDHVATPVDFQDIPEDAASNTVPWYRTDRVVVWFRNVSDLNLAKQMFVDDINALQKTYDVLTSKENFERQSDIEFTDTGVHEESAPEEDEGSIEEDIAAMKTEIEGKLSKDALNGVEFETNDAAGIRKAVKIMGKTLGAKIVKSIALAFGLWSLYAQGAGFSGDHYAQLDLDENPIIVTNVTFSGLATTGELSAATTNLNARPVVTPPDVSERGVTFIDQYGENQNVAIEIGEGAKAAVTTNALESAADNKVVRSTGVAVGGHAEVRNDADPLKIQGVALGWHAQVSAINGIAIGGGAEHTNDTYQTSGAAIASAPKTIAIGYAAKAGATDAVQLGEGVNNEARTLKFLNTTIVADGRLQVDEDGITSRAVRDAKQAVMDEGYTKMQYTERDGYKQVRIYGEGEASGTDAQLVLRLMTNREEQVAVNLGDAQLYTAQRIDAMTNDLWRAVGRFAPISWTTLKEMRDTWQLKPGQQYRITNYVATTNGDMDSRSANHPFDIVVTADGERTLNEHARAVLREGDTYFADCDVAAWDIWYCIDNDTDRFAWATAANGKGVVYRLVDEFGNDAPYDFKGIQFLAYGDTDGVYRYTFDSGVVSGNTDLSLRGWTSGGSYSAVYENTIAPYSEESVGARLNRIVFKGSGCYSNTFGSDCYSNTFGSDCYSNTFGSGCYSNTFGSDCSSNTFGADCSDNTFGSICSANMFGSYCQYNTFGRSCNSNTFSSNCYGNTFGPGCRSNTFGDICYSNAFGSYCQYNTFGSGCYSITFGTESSVKSYCRYIRVGSGNRNLYINPTGTTSSSQYYQNVEIKEGVNNTGSYKTIDDPNVNQTYLTTYKPADSQEISL